MFLKSSSTGSRTAAGYVCTMGNVAQQKRPACTHPHSCFPLQLVQRVTDWYTLMPFSVRKSRRFAPEGAVRAMSGFPSCLTVTVISGGGRSAPVSIKQAHRLENIVLSVRINDPSRQKRWRTNTHTHTHTSNSTFSPVCTLTNYHTVRESNGLPHTTA